MSAVFVTAICLSIIYCVEYIIYILSVIYTMVYGHFSFYLVKLEVGTNIG